MKNVQMCGIKQKLIPSQVHKWC